jgi:hypothetical protein
VERTPPLGAGCSGRRAAGAPGGTCDLLHENTVGRLRQATGSKWLSMLRNVCIVFLDVCFLTWFRLFPGVHDRSHVGSDPECAWQAGGGTKG